MRLNILRSAAIGLLVLAPLAIADDAPDQDKAQYEAVAKSRADAELAVQRARDFFNQGEESWKQTAQSIEAARAADDSALMKTIDAEEKKQDDTRDQKVIDAAEQQRRDLDARWQQYGIDQGPPLEASFHDADNNAQASSQLLHALEEVETQLKATRSDLAPLTQLYDETAASASKAMDDGTTALNSLKSIDQTWEPTTQPSGN
jgi:hypothetical protein